MMSPAFSSTMSPLTISFMGTSFTLPALITVAFTCTIARNFSRARLAFLSCQKPITPLSAMIPRMITEFVYSPSADARTTANTNINTKGLLNCRINTDRSRMSGCGALIALCFLLRWSTCSELSPFMVE